MSAGYGFKRPEDRFFPPMIFAEITNVCNLACVHCPHSWIKNQEFYRPRHMDFGVFKKIVDELSGVDGVILRLICDGEPMLHPDFLKMVKYSKANSSCTVCFTTNGTLLNGTAAQEILACNADVVEISLDAAKGRTYETIRRGAKFEEVVGNTLGFIEKRNRSGSRTRIMVSIIDQPAAASEIEEFVRFWTPRVDRVITRKFTSIGGLVDNPKAPAPDSARWPCPLLWTRIFINVDGDIKFCVDDWLDKTVVANVKELSLREAWTMPEYEAMRRSHLAGDFQAVEHCSKCGDWQAREWGYDYFFALEQILKVGG